MAKCVVWRESGTSDNKNCNVCVAVCRTVFYEVYENTLERTPLATQLWAIALCRQNCNTDDVAGKPCGTV